MLDKIIEYLNNDNNISFAYLFGSYAKGKQRKDSDIDVAVYIINLPKEIFFDYKMKIKIELEESIRREMDIIILNSAPPLLKHQVFTEGKQLKCIDVEIMNNYKIKSFYEYLDIIEINKVIFAQTKKLIKRKIKNG